MLSSASSYFTNLFANDSRRKEFRLDDLSGAVLKLLVDYAYTGRIQITIDNVESLYVAVLRYKLYELDKECVKQRHKSITSIMER